jgi:hypothetical protein
MAAGASEPPKALWSKITAKNPGATFEESYKEPNGHIEITYYTNEGRAVSTFDESGKEIASELSLNPDVMPQPIKTLITAAHPDAEISIFTKKSVQNKVTYEIEVNDGTHYIAYIFDQSFQVVSKNVQIITDEEQDDLLDYGTRGQ